MSAFDPVRLELRFADRPMAVLAFRQDLNAFALEFDPAFVREGHDLSPLHLPLELYGTGVHVFGADTTPFPGGLPGLIADSLPDAWGEKLLRQELPEVRTIMGKLAAVGNRGPGAITFDPALGSSGATGATMNLRELADAANKLRAATVALTTDRINQQLAQGGSSLGGAFPKIAAYLPLGAATVLEKREILVGGKPPSGHVPCILKFERENDEADGAVEFAFTQMAKEAGLRVPQTCLVQDGRRRHFATARFDRILGPRGAWLTCHVHTLAGLLHKRASDGAIDYEEFIRLARTLGGAPEAVECFRRAVFNLLSTNRDDHGRNHAFLYDENVRRWALAPAYDLNPNVANVLIGLSWLGSTRIPATRDELLRLAEVGGVPAKQARSIYEQVEEAVLGGWPKHAAEASVPTPMISYWAKEIAGQTKELRNAMRPASRRQE